MAIANEFHSQGNVSKANKHWQFAINDVARHALQLQLPYDGPKGNVQIWTEGIIDMQRIAQDRCIQRRAVPIDILLAARLELFM